MISTYRGQKRIEIQVKIDKSAIIEEHFNIFSGTDRGKNGPLDQLNT